MKLSLICEDHEKELAKKIIRLIAKGHGTNDPKELAGQVWASEFFTAPLPSLARGEDDEDAGAGMEEDDLRAAFNAGLIVSADAGNWKLSDKAFELAGVSGDDKPQGIISKIMGGAAGFSDVSRAFQQASKAMRGGR